MKAFIGTFYFWVLGETYTVYISLEINLLFPFVGAAEGKSNEKWGMSMNFG